MKGGVILQYLGDQIYGRVEAAAPPKCKHCGEYLVVPDAGAHYCPESWQEARRARVAEAVRLLESEGYVVWRRD